MGQFESIKINGFRRLKEVDLPLRALCVMIGPNGSGKTSFHFWQLRLLVFFGRRSVKSRV
jgi:predicted ATPase